ncbi:MULTISPECIES: hypothetical protein [Olivibacter]|jgi:hypothetical protein|uniref:Stationary phase survival protein SurE n=3 Tax=Sphingobacteriaceae TaxID=84566 RepID=F4C4T4_SPHS2|nr:MULTISPECIES: hypothetical protein [Olivibacter]MCL4641329.1 hypothetical protein [Olivibacter sp. UJ_SKK_5.1]MDM8173874.1 hypothetical protein [Olivibacter sp. 47]MDX3915058.1 hypothetical protein [Pseudosphingobacterium sp.]QEL03663.1 hypothetical protein FKG96_23450 [Olivibacter sp. LS-1]
MLKKNNPLLGILLGAIAPLIAFLFNEYTSLGSKFADKPLTLYAIAGAVNLLIVRYCYKQQASKTGGSVMGITFIGLILILYFKGGIKV